MRRGARTSASAPMRLAAGADELRLDAAEMSCLWSRSNTARLVESIRLPDERVDVDAAVNGVGDNQDESGGAAAVRARATSSGMPLALTTPNVPLRMRARVRVGRSRAVGARRDGIGPPGARGALSTATDGRLHGRGGGWAFRKLAASAPRTPEEMFFEDRRCAGARSLGARRARPWR